MTTTPQAPSAFDISGRTVLILQILYSRVFPSPRR